MTPRDAAALRRASPRRRRPLCPAPWDWSDVLLFFLLFFLGLAIAEAILLAAPVEAFGRSLLRGLSPQTQTAAGSLLLQTVTYAVGIAVLLGLVVGRHHASLGDLGWRMPRSRWIPIAVAAAAVSVVALAFAGDGLQALFPHVQNAQVPEVQAEFGKNLALAIPTVCVVAPLAEETFFRGFIYAWMRRHLNVPAAAVLSGCFFAAAHLSYGAQSELLIGLPLALLGVVLALLYEYSGSLLPGVIVHALFNLVNLVRIL